MLDEPFHLQLGALSFGKFGQNGLQIEITAVRQEHIPPETCRVRQVVVFGIGIRAQHNGDGSILEHIQGAMELDGSGLDGAETAGEDVSEGLVEGKRTAILQDKSVEFTKSL